MLFVRPTFISQLHFPNAIFHRFRTDGMPEMIGQQRKGKRRRAHSGTHENRALLNPQKGALQATLFQRPLQNLALCLVEQ